MKATLIQLYVCSYRRETYSREHDVYLFIPEMYTIHAGEIHDNRIASPGMYFIQGRTNQNAHLICKCCGLIHVEYISESNIQGGWFCVKGAGGTITPSPGLMLGLVYA